MGGYRITVACSRRLNYTTQRYVIKPNVIFPTLGSVLVLTTKKVYDIL